MTAGLIVLLVLEFLILLTCLSFEKVGWAFLSFLACFAAVHFGLGVSLVEPLLSDLPLTCGLFFGYLVAGGIYSVPRWYFRVKRTARKLALYQKSLVEKDDRVRYDILRRNDLLERMQPTLNRSVITGWITFWPVDMLILLFEEPVAHIYEQLVTTYQRISKKALQSNGLEDLVKDIE